MIFCLKSIPAETFAVYIHRVRALPECGDSAEFRRSMGSTFKGCARYRDYVRDMNVTDAIANYATVLRQFARNNFTFLACG